jgi:hypothetical protein
MKNENKHKNIETWNQKKFKNLFLKEKKHIFKN